MLNFLKKNIYIIIIFLLTAFVFGKFIFSLNFPDAGYLLSTDKDFVLKVAPKNSVSQKFSSARDGLTKIDFLLRNFETSSGDQVLMKLADENCSKILAEGNIEKSFLSAGSLYEFSFPRINNSANETFCLIATFEPKKKTKAVEFFLKNDSQDGFLINNSSAQQSLSMRPVYTNTYWWQNLRELDQRLSQYKPWFLKQYYLAAIAILFVALSIATIVILIII